MTAGVLAESGAKGTGDPVDSGSSIKDLARLLVQDKRKVIPVSEGDKIIGGMNRESGLSVLLEAD